MSVMLLYLLYFLCCYRNVDGEEEVTVFETPDGFIKGHLINNAFYAFEGIQYGNITKRFQAAEAVNPWEGVLDALEPGPACQQISLPQFTVTGQEDCLTLSVFVPKNISVRDHNLPVIFYVHGGYFHLGQAPNVESSSPELLINEQTIVVSIQYRLGVFGFLSFEDYVLPGNAGLKDVALALYWVRKNIAAFGGDPKQITAMGHSAGAAIAQLLTLSPVTRGIVKGVILLSGTANSHWAFSRHPRKDAEILGDIFKCNRDTSELLLECLESIETANLALAQYSSISLQHTDAGLGVFLPCVEPRTNKAFISDHPFELLKQGQFDDVPVLLGTAQRELAIIESVLNFDLIDINVRFNIFKALKKNFLQETWPPFSLTDNAETKLRIFYMNNTKMTMNNSDAMVNFITDLAFLRPAEDYVTLKLRHQKSDVFQYFLTFDSELSSDKVNFFAFPPKGASHSDILTYVFISKPDSLDSDQAAALTAKKFVKAITAFAKYGNPTPDSSLGVIWLPATSEKRNYLEISSELKVLSNIERERMQAWDEARQMDGIAI